MGVGELPALLTDTVPEETHRRPWGKEDALFAVDNHLLELRRNQSFSAEAGERHSVTSTAGRVPGEGQLAGDFPGDPSTQCPSIRCVHSVTRVVGGQRV